MYADVIDPVIKVLRHIMVLTADFEHAKRQRESLHTVLRKLMVIKELHTTSFVSVTGTQGAGKTRLMKEIYGLDGWLDDNAGRGEKRPLFILESDCSEPQATGVTFDGTEEQINHDTLTRELRSFSDNEQYLLLRLYVPRRHFEPGFGFLLLPGYERINRDNQLWQREMRDTLRHSMGSILMTDQTRMADHATVQVLNDLMNKCFESRLPIIAISRTERRTEAEREDLRASAADVCGVDKVAQFDRVVCTGVGDAWREQWLPVLLEAVHKYCRSSRDVNRQRLEDLGSVVDVELEEAFTLLEDLISKVDGRATVQTLLIDQVLACFRESSEKYRKGFERALYDRGNSYASLVSKAARDDYVANEQGFLNKVNNVVSGDDERFVQRIEHHWKQLGTRTPLDVTFLALSDMASSSRGLKLEYSKNRVMQEDQVRQISQRGMPALLGYEGSSGTVQLFGEQMDPVQLQGSLRLLLQRTSSNVDTLDSHRAGSREITHALELLPTLCMEYLRVAHAAVLAVEPGRLPTSNVQEIEPETVLQQIQEGLPKLAQTTQDLMKAVLSIGAVDLAIDGSLDLPTILTGGGAAGLGATLSGAAAGIITLGFVGYKVTQAMRQYDLEQKNFIDFCMYQLASQQVEKTLQRYDDVIEEVGERLKHNLHTAYGVDGEMFSERDALARAMHALKRVRRDLSREIDFVQQRYLA